YQRLRRGRPLWVTLGNHDVVAGHGAAQLRHLGLPDLPYAKSLPGLELLFLDANRVDEAQASWLDDRLSAPGPELRTVVFHQPAWSCSSHDSTYQRFVSPGGVTYVVTAGGGRQLYPVDGCAKGAPERVAEVVRHHFTAVEVRDGSLAVTAVAAAAPATPR